MQHRINVLFAGVLAAALLLSGSVQALFGLGKNQEETAPEGAPTALDLSVRTYRGVPFQGRLQADGEDRALHFAIVTQPKKGAVTLEGDLFTYTPKENVSGSDSFTYAAVTEEGVSSRPAAVRITIEKVRSGVKYGDTPPSAATAAQYLAEAGIFTGAQIGEVWYFEPQRTVTRGEFCAMVLETVGAEVTPVGLTGFCDDEAIPVWGKGYASAAAAEGIVKGRSTPEGAAFSWDDPISYNEAATVLNRALALGDVELSVWFAGRETLPSWADQAVGNMEAMQVLAAGSFGSGTLDTAVTREAAAGMLCAAAALLTRQRSGGLPGGGQ